MLTTIVLSFLAGAWSGNGVPHVVRGITRRRYPSALGSGPVPNLVAGWFALSTTPLWPVWSPAGSTRWRRGSPGRSESWRSACSTPDRERSAGPTATLRTTCRVTRQVTPGREGQRWARPLA